LSNFQKAFGATPNRRKQQEDTMTGQEQRFLRDFEAFMASPPASIEGIRAQIETFTQRHEALVSGTPRIGDYHEKVRLRDALHADVAVPQGPGPHPVVLFLHGGAWVAGSPATHRRLAQRFAEAGYLTVNLDYRLAPEHPFPAGYDDCLFAARWVRENAGRWRGQPDRIAIGGDSAGGNLAAAVAVGAGAGAFRAALLIYGVFDFVASAERGGAGFEGLARAYLGAGFPAFLADPRVTPLRGVTSKFPPAFLIVGSADALLPESLAMAEALKTAGVPHELCVAKDMIHAFMQFEMLEECHQGLAEMFAFLRHWV
jgi:acetyl esterase